MRISGVSILGLLYVAVCSAGSIEIGGANGLTSAYVNQTAGAGQAACAAGVGGCLAGSATSFGERNYNIILFGGATPPAVPFTGYVQGTATASGSALDQFAMISDGTTGGSSRNYWDSTSSGSTLVVPIGIADVTDVWTMLNNVSGLAGGTDTSVTFDFGTSSNASTFNEVVVVTLTNAGAGGTTGTGQIGSSFVCATPSTACTTNDNGTVASSSTATATLNSNPTAGLGVTTDVLYNPDYTSATGAYAGSSGSLVLNGQDFNLAALVAPSANEYLVNVVVKEATGSTGLTGLSAITVDTVPEPSTIFLFLSGLGALGVARFRRK